MKTANYNFDIDLSKVILWQYDDAEKLKSLVNNEQQFMDTAVTQFWEDFNYNVFNLATCNTFGLELWGKLLGVARPTYLDEGVVVEYSDEQYRLVLQARIYLLTFDGSGAALNQFFKMLFPEYPVIITDNLDMTVTIGFVQEPTDEIKTILQNENFLPRPSGTRYIMNWSINYEEIFGFEGQEPCTNFDNGTFFPD